MEGRINVRMASLNKRKIEKSIHHDMRTRKDLAQVDYSKSKDNYYSHTSDEFRKVYAAAKAEHRELYKKVYGRNPQEDRINALQEGIITFPAIYQKYYEEGKFSQDDLLRMFEKFAKQLEEDSGLRVISKFIHQDEKTIHIHFHTTNYIVQGEDAGKHFNPKGWYSHLQDIGGHAFSDIGLRRGNPKESTKAKHVTTREHATEIIKNADAIEDTLSNEFSISDIEELIKTTVTPLKTMLTYMKRALQIDKEASYIIKQQKRALSKFAELFPSVENIENIEDMMQYIADNHKEKGKDWNKLNEDKNKRNR